MVTCSPRSEEIIYEQADEVPGHGTLLFVSVLSRDEQQNRVTRESHVFHPGEERHLHEINHFSRGCADDDTLRADCVRATHRLFADQLLRAGNPRASGGEGVAYATRRLDAHPFHDLRLRGKFLATMWEIQDWTVSPGLRDALGRVTRSRADASEAALLARIFSAD